MIGGILLAGDGTKLRAQNSKKTITIRKIIERHEFAVALEINKQNRAENPQIYAQRQAIVEHPFGTMKRAWGFDHIMTKKEPHQMLDLSSLPII